MPSERLDVFVGRLLPARLRAIVAESNRSSASDITNRRKTFVERAALAPVTGGRTQERFPGSAESAILAWRRLFLRLRLRVEPRSQQAPTSAVTVPPAPASNWDHRCSPKCCANPICFPWRVPGMPIWALTERIRVRESSPNRRTLDRRCQAGKCIKSPERSQSSSRTDAMDARQKTLLVKLVPEDARRRPSQRCRMSSIRNEAEKAEQL